MPRQTFFARLFTIAALLLLGSLVAVHLGFFAIRTIHLLAYPFPLDYGEGPLLAQVNLLRDGLPFWQLYRDPAVAPYTVVNYPPIYHVVTWLVALVTVPLIGDGPHGVLLAGRIVSLLAGLLCVPALVVLATRSQESGVRSQKVPRTENQYARIAIRADGTEGKGTSEQEPRAEHQGPSTEGKGTSEQGCAYSYTRQQSFIDRSRGITNEHEHSPTCITGAGNRVPSGRERFLAAATRSGMNTRTKTTEPRTKNKKPRTKNQEPQNHRTKNRIAIVLVGLAWLGIPIVREWSSVMRVDLLGVCMGLWGLVLLQRRVGTWAILWAAPLLAGSLLVKPSLLAAPLAALIWLVFRDWRRAIALGALIGAIGGLAIAALQLASGGWFWVHVVSANANRWDFDLAHGFWRDQFVLMQPLLLAAVLAIGAGVLFNARMRLLLPLYYTLFGLLTALGVGKLGAYSNYFLEAYVGLFWLAAAGVAGIGGTLATITYPKRLEALRTGILPSMLLILTALALTRYYPLWSEEYLLAAGIIEGRNPVRISIGGNGVWQDLQREQVILNARANINRVMAEPIRAANGPIFTDIPGVAAQLGIVSREQVFEQRMLFDIGLWDQRPLLRDMAAGRVPLIVLDYLGNWLTPAQISMITHRYAQDLSIGTYSIYRPIDSGPRQDLDLDFPHGLRTTGVHLTQPGDGGSSYSPGETVAVTLEWRQTATDMHAAPDVVLQLTDRTGRPLFETIRPLLYGALAPADWGDGEIQHLQPLSLPPELPPGAYRLALTMRVNGLDLAAPRDLGVLTVAESGGRILGEQGYYVPVPLMAEWERLGGYGGPGDPVMPAVPFAGVLQQCFKTTCLRLAHGQIERLPVGELAWLADAALPRISGAPAEGQLSPAFQQLYDQSGGVATLGPVLGVEMKRFGDIVQYTRYARLERPLAGGAARLGAVGEDVLRLPGGMAYRWP